MKSWRRKRSFQGGVCFHGYEPKPEKFYKRAKILLLCSEFEGFGMVLIEAQRFGTVPVSFAMSEGPEYILSDGGGVLVSNNDLDAMTETLDKLMSDDVLLGELSASARLRSEEWTIEKVGMLWKNLIEEL